MSDTSITTTELASQYSTQVADDLERNLKEQERLNGEIAALQAQLAALRHDHTMLGSIQQALGTSAAPVAEPVTSVPSPRKKQQPTAKAAGKQKRAAQKAATPARKQTGKKAPAKTAATSSAAPKLVDLVREHLTGQSEPRSAAEISTALGQQHPERTIKTTVVRTTLEGLVAKAQAQRTKQGASVYYTAPDATQSKPADRTEGQPESAKA